ncbi:hypothetical protein FDI24_gp034 [Acidovorax phage ACP17]|uniref:Uncharacterized protein n=1 Tax=Acidovorax phage ACP17 TaxID=2010329 RepID=A0A218M3F5_9CAUD|nr:hypothetical protein FDI24_gp034 [Acidovorax phage ACP17]ASD50568.1 hypothetical protein [Acidovorax phage ACP17]
MHLYIDLNSIASHLRVARDQYLRDAIVAHDGAAAYPVMTPSRQAFESLAKQFEHQADEARKYAEALEYAHHAEVITETGSISVDYDDRS